MARTKTLGIRLTPEIVDRLAVLKDDFSFESYADIIVSMVSILQGVDRQVCKAKGHPWEWDPHQVQQDLGLGNGLPALYLEEVKALVWRRVKQKFGEDGMQKLRELIEDHRK